MHAGHVLICILSIIAFKLVERDVAKSKQNQ